MHLVIAAIATGALVYRAWSHRLLTPAGMFMAFLTAIAHAVHPSSLPFALLVVFFVVGVKATKVKHGIKARLTISSGGSSGGEGPRTHVQVLANSGVASLLSLLHVWKLWRNQREFSCIRYGRGDDLFMIGIIANYAAVAADTLSSELGILSPSQPRLITSFNLRKVPRGTNGGVTVMGLMAGSLGAFLIGMTTISLTSFCPAAVPGTANSEQRLAWSGVPGPKVLFALIITIWGTLGSLLDSVLGGILQASVVDKRSGKIIEGSGGRKSDRTNANSPTSFCRATDVKGDGGQASESIESREVAAGVDILDNNQVNLLMAASMSILAIATAGWLWDVPLRSIYA
ncbi:hypothetical protein KEM54_005486 [Ascosphaera aggregata]|nr:hypothetical protein KEM54_005486 [Ascosphaera aggregata]